MNCNNCGGNTPTHGCDNCGVDLCCECRYRCPTCGAPICKECLDSGNCSNC